MKAILFPGDEKVQITEMPKPQPGPNQVLIAVRAAGLCGSDLHQHYRVPSNEREGEVLGHKTSARTIPGHEPAGVVAEVGMNVSTLSVGDRVAVAHVSGCGHCVPCRRGRDIDCPEKAFYGLDLDGAFAEFMLAEAKDCVALPEAISCVEGAIWACGAGTGFTALTAGNLVSGEVVVIVGLGPVGDAACFFAKMAGARVIGVDPMKERRDYAQTLGAEHVFDPVDAQSRVEALTHGKGADLVVEASGTPAGRTATIELACVGGRIVYVGLNDKPTEFKIDRLIQKNLTCIGSWVFGTPDLKVMIDRAADLGISVEKLVTHTYSVGEAEQAVAEFNNGSLGKTVIVWD